MIEYYTPNRRCAIREAKNYQDLLKIAMEIIEDITEGYPCMDMAIVCGPISTGGTGSRVENLIIFDRAITRIINDGLIVFNQMPFEENMDRLVHLSPDMGGTRLLEEFYLPIFESGLIGQLCFLPGWEKSIGAAWEHKQAKRLKIPVLKLHQSYMND